MGILAQAGDGVGVVAGTDKAPSQPSQAKMAGTDEPKTASAISQTGQDKAAKKAAVVDAPQPAALPADTKGQGVKEQLKDWTKVEKPEVPEKVAQGIKEAQDQKQPRSSVNGAEMASKDVPVEPPVKALKTAGISPGVMETSSEENASSEATKDVAHHKPQAAGTEDKTPGRAESIKQLPAKDMPHQKLAKPSTTGEGPPAEVEVSGVGVKAFPTTKAEASLTGKDMSQTGELTTVSAAADTSPKSELMKDKAKHSTTTKSDSPVTYKEAILKGIHQATVAKETVTGAIESGTSTEKIPENDEPGTVVHFEEVTERKEVPSLLGTGDISVAKGPPDDVTTKTAGAAEPQMSSETEEALAKGIDKMPEGRGTVSAKLQPAGEKEQGLPTKVSDKLVSTKEVPLMEESLNSQVAEQVPSTNVDPGKVEKKKVHSRDGSKTPAADEASVALCEPVKVAATVHAAAKSETSSTGKEFSAPQAQGLVSKRSLGSGTGLAKEDTEVAPTVKSAATALKDIALMAEKTCQPVTAEKISSNEAGIGDAQEKTLDTAKPVVSVPEVQSLSKEDMKDAPARVESGTNEGIGNVAKDSYGTIPEIEATKAVAAIGAAPAVADKDATGRKIGEKKPDVKGSVPKSKASASQKEFQKEEETNSTGSSEPGKPETIVQKIDLPKVEPDASALGGASLEKRIVVVAPKDAPATTEESAKVDEKGAPGEEPQDEKTKDPEATKPVSTGDAAPAAESLSKDDAAKPSALPTETPPTERVADRGTIAVVSNPLHRADTPSEIVSETPTKKVRTPVVVSASSAPTRSKSASGAKPHKELKPITEEPEEKGDFADAPQQKPAGTGRPVETRTEGSEGNEGEVAASSGPAHSKGGFQEHKRTPRESAGPRGAPRAHAHYHRRGHGRQHHNGQHESGGRKHRGKKKS